LTLLHPFAPFVTETIWQTLAWEPDSLLIIRPWPEVPSTDAEQSKNFEELKTIVTEIRYIMSSLKLKESTLHYIAPQFIKDNAELIERLTHVKTITEVQLRPGLRLTKTSYQCWLDVDHKVLEGYKNELAKNQKTQQAIVNKLEQRLANLDYIASAPAEVIEQSRQQLMEEQTALATIEQEYQRFVPPKTVKPESEESQAQPPTTAAHQ
jgi:valyl-tRNA synthetase